MDKAQLAALANDKLFREKFAQSPIEALHDAGIDVDSLPAHVLDKLHAAGSSDSNYGPSGSDKPDASDAPDCFDELLGGFF